MKNHYVKIHLWLLLLVITFPGIAQQKMISGTIIDEMGKPVVNAMVTIKDQSRTKVFTNRLGEFSILGESGQLLEVETRDQKVKSIRIDSDEIMLTISDVDQLIPIGHRMERRKDEITSSIGFVQAEELTANTAINPANALYGKIPGLTVLQNGGPNWASDPDIYIRGIETFGIGSFVNTKILVLVDGFERPISSLSVAEIESVTVLKDAAALAMYGLRGANGVLLVTTKRGTGSRLSTNVNYSQGRTKAFRLPEFLDANGYANAINQARTLDGLPPLYSQHDIARFQSGGSPYLYPNVNWIDESLRDYGTTNDFNISFQQQAENVRYFAILNYYREEGLFGPVDLNEGYSTQSKFDKFNFRTNLDIDISRTTKLEVKLAGNSGEWNRPRGSESNIFSAIYNTPSAAYPVRTYNKIESGTRMQWGGTSTYSNNPVALISGIGYDTEGRRDLMTDVVLKQKLDLILDGLSAEGGFSFDRSFDYMDRRSNQFQYEELIPILNPVTGAIEDTISTLYGANTTTSFSTTVPGQWRRATAFGNLNYSTQWDDNQLSSVLLFQSEEFIRTGQHNTYRRLLAASHLHYGKAGKYFADLSMSYNGTNVLPKSKRWGFFPALSLAWKISNEEWLRESSFFDNLKLRASIGMSGSDQVIQNISMTPIVSSTGYFFGPNNIGQGGYIEGRLVSSPSYETSYKSNIGIDARMFRILGLSMDVFYNRRTGILVETGGSISDVLGVVQPYSSSGITHNKGIELGLNLQQNVGDLSYRFGGQLSYSKSKIIEMHEVYRPHDHLKRTGQSINQAFGLEAIGFFANQADIDASPKHSFSIVRPGDIKYKDQNGDGVIDIFDEVPIGYNTKIPNIYYSGALGIGFKRLGIDLHLQGAANQTIYLNTPSIFLPLRSNTNISTFSKDSWTLATASSAKLPRLSTLENANNYRPNSIWYTDGSFLKLRSAELYFNFPENFLSNVKLSNAKLYLRGINLFSLDKIKIIDPEEIGITYPTVSSYHMGIQIGF
jgi:TonB-linked SusC/RagA family outer membrane protein